MSKRAFDVRIDAKQVEGLADKLGLIGEEQIADAAVQAVNEGVDYAFDAARKAMTDRINVTDAYVQRKMRIARRASRSQPSAEIVAPFAPKERSLGQYDPIAQVVPVKARPGTKAYERLKGNSALGIPKGMKQQGVSVEVVAGQRDAGFVPRGFLMNLKNANGLGLFARRRSGTKQHRYGPSVNQMLGLQAGILNDEIAENLGDALVAAVNRVFDRALD